MDVEFRVPVSPTPQFALMLSVLFHSIKQFSGLSHPRLTAVIGASAAQARECENMAAWLKPRISSVIIDPAEFEARSFHATSARRLTMRSDADIVILIDADTLVCGDLSSLCRDTLASPAVSGVMAHVRPCSHSEWQTAFASIGLEASFPYRYSGWPYMWGERIESLVEVDAPAYFNLGLVVLPRALLSRVGCEYLHCLDVAARTLPMPMFQSQAAITLALAKSDTPARSLPMRFNFPNDYRLEALFPAELQQARMIHLLRTTQGLKKQELYSSIQSLEQFVAQSWRWAGAADRARRVVAQVLDDVRRAGVPDGLATPEWAW